MSRIKNSAVRSKNIIRDRAHHYQAELNHVIKNPSIRTKQIATATGYVVGMVTSVVAVAAIVQRTSKAEYTEDED